VGVRNAAVRKWEIVGNRDRLIIHTIGYHIQTNNKDNLLSMDFGLKEFGIKGRKDRVQRYRRYIYEAGALEHPEKDQASV
jgi:hypothetical protein